MSKELILIVAYCPNKERKEILFDFLKQLQMFRCSYDILVASHTPLDVNFFEYFDYFYYDKNNVILTDIDFKKLIFKLLCYSLREFRPKKTMKLYLSSISRIV